MSPNGSRVLTLIILFLADCGLVSVAGVLAVAGIRVMQPWHANFIIANTVKVHVAGLLLSVVQR